MKATKSEIRHAIATLDNTLIKLNGQKAELPNSINNVFDSTIKAIENQISELRNQFIAA